MKSRSTHDVTVLLHAPRSHHPLLDAHHVASGFSMSTVTQTDAAVVAVCYALTIAAAKGVIAEGP